MAVAGQPVAAATGSAQPMSRLLTTCSSQCEDMRHVDTERQRNRERDDKERERERES